MSVSYRLGYCKSKNAVCHGPPPCKGTAMPPGTLRLGKVTQTQYEQTVEWRHWGCITPEVLTALAAIKADNIPGLSELKDSDQRKIRIAINLQRIDPFDIPASAKQVGAMASGSVSAPGASQKKRKAAFETAQANSASTSAPGNSQSMSFGASQRFAPQSARNFEEEENIPHEEEVPDVLYVVMSSNVVGIQYYHGLVGSGEEVRLQREPHNRYDANAIQVKNISNVQVGHIPRAVASKLAPLMDRRRITVEGVVKEGNIGGRVGYQLGLTLKIYGPADKRDELEPDLVWATPGQRGFGNRGNAAAGSSARGASGGAARTSYGNGSAYPGSQYGGYGDYPMPSASQVATQTPAQKEAARKRQEELAKAAELKSMLTTLEKVDDEGRRSSLLDTLCSVDDILSLPEHASPPGIGSGNMKVDLLKHQSQALAWSIEKEYPNLPKKESDRPVQFWQLSKTGNKTYYYNIATKTPQEAPPALNRGGLNADAMGLGKTLTIISLILATMDDKPSGFSKTTLIVAPLSVISNWEKQIIDHCSSNALTFCVYHGTGRNMSASDIAKYDVCITTYQTVAGEFNADQTNASGGPTKKRKTERALFDTKWKRVVLDEGHNIRNPKTKMSKACCGLTAQRRWVLSGTPIINSPRDLGSILSFLRICAPLDNEDFFKRLVLRPLKDGMPEGAELLRGIMSSVCIRRTKEMQDKDGKPLVPLPPVEMIVVPVALSPDVRALYDEVEALSKQRFERYMSRPTSISSNVLGLLTRMRQIVLHPGLLPPNYLEELKAADEEEASGVVRTKPITPEEKYRLQVKLAKGVEDSEECPICFMPISEPRITICTHIFCLPCITEVITRDPKCPMDRRPLAIGDLVEPMPAAEAELTQRALPVEEAEEDSGMGSGSSAKIEQLVHLLKLTPSSEKSLVFSQFTSFLDKIGEALSAEGISYVRFDGQMSAKRRQETLANFSIPVVETAENVVEDVPDSSAPTTSRRRRANRKVVIDDSDFTDGGDDDDFVMNASDPDDDFKLDSSSPVRPQAKKNKGKQKARSYINQDEVGDLDFSGGGRNPRVMLISLKAGALGLNLTVANNVYLMDPWWQEGIESQAIDRVNRIGQKKDVHVYQLIAENTVESKVLDIQERKKKLITEAFSGIKRTETKRNQREARLQDLIELFGVRERAASQAS